MVLRPATFRRRRLRSSLVWDTAYTMPLSSMHMFSTLMGTMPAMEDSCSSVNTAFFSAVRKVTLDWFAP